MSGRAKLGLALLAAALLAGAAIWRVLRAPKRGLPNILVVTCDTLRADRLGLYGHSRPTSPHLDELAKESVVFERFFANASFTPPSHGSILTGLYPNSHGLLWWNDKLLPAAYTLGELLGTPKGQEGKRGLGYRTAAFVNLDNFGLMDVTRGFEHVRSENWFPGDDLNRDFLAWLDSLGAEGSKRPFCAWLHYWDPHRPFGYREWHWLEPKPAKGPEELAAMPPGERDRYLRLVRASRRPALRFHETMFGAGDLGVGRMESHYNRVESKRHEPVDVPLEGGGYARRALTPEDDRFLVDRYDGGVAYLDQWLGELVAALRARDLLDRTLLVVTSDHGESFTERAGEWFTHDPHLYDEVTRVPLLIRLPGSARGGTRVGSIGESVDLLPTIFDVLGLPTGKFQGRSLLPEIQGRDGGDAGRAAFSQTQLKREVVEGGAKRWALGERKYALRTATHRLIWTVEAKANAYELYDLAADPKEMRNVYATSGALGPALGKRLEEWLARTPQADVSDQFTPEMMSTVPGGYFR